jgi:F0F1-type ATP synthase delta subunit
MEFAKAISEDMESMQQSPKIFIDGLVSFLKNVRKVEMTLAFHPTRSQVTRVVSWIRSQLKLEAVVIEIKYDPKLIGGAILIWNGEYRDLTLKKKLENYFKGKLSEIIQIAVQA